MDYEVLIILRQIQVIIHAYILTYNIHIMSILRVYHSGYMYHHREQ